MIDSVATGLVILDSETRIQTDAGLVKITDLEGSPGPQGPQGEQGVSGHTNNYLDIVHQNRG